MAVIKDSASSYGHAPMFQGPVDSWSDDLGLLPLLLTLILPVIIGLILLISCVFNQCCPRKSTAKEELFGVEGRMTMLSNTEIPYGVNNNAPASLDPDKSNSFTKIQLLEKKSSIMNNRTVAAVIHKKSIDTSSSLDSVHSHDITDGGSNTVTPSDSYNTLEPTNNSLKRSAVQRQLPDLPKVVNTPRRSNSVQSHDGTSELYATVEEFPEGRQQRVDSGNHLYSAIINQPSTSGVLNRCQKENANEPNPSSDSETYGTAASNHPYAKLVKKQSSINPYAKVKKSGSSPGIAEIVDDADETDTDNYDVSHQYAQIIKITRDNLGSSGASSSNPHVENSSNSSASGNGTPIDSNNPNLSVIEINGRSQNPTSVSVPEHPIRPSRSGRQWTNNNDQVHFSGDSQDSRGYTSISVREPLSNIRLQANELSSERRMLDASYAIMSDDSEEMYAAIEESADVNYMEIGEDSRDWREHREANSPLPPLPGCSGIVPEQISGITTATSSLKLSPTLPIYAQVLKKKKSPTNPVPHNGASPCPVDLRFTSQNNHSVELSNVPGSSALSSTSSVGIVKHHRRHPSKVLDPSMDPIHDPERRWSKADINYSEFEIIREPMFPLVSTVLDNNNSTKVPHMSNSVATVSNAKPTKQLDEDNYNIILSPNINATAKSSNCGSSGNSRACSEETNDLYHEISDPKKVENKTRGNNYLDLELKREESDEEDELYETVKFKPSFATSTTSTLSEHKSSTRTHPITSKHGYEKIRKKQSIEIPVSFKIASDSVSSDVTKILEPDFDEAPESSLYEQVKFPPYERLQESRDSVYSDNDNLYEDIRYTKVTKSKGVRTLQTCQSPGVVSPGVSDNPTNKYSDTRNPNSICEVDQLYARIDRSKKQKHPNKTDSSVTDKIGTTLIPLDPKNSVEYI